MIVTEIVGNIAELSTDDARERDYVILDNEARVKRIQRVTTQSGREVGLRLDADVREIVDGDILGEEDGTLIVAKIAPSDVLVIQPRTITEALEVAHALGNRHLQAQFFDGSGPVEGEAMVVRYDHTVEHFLDHTEVPYHRGEYVMPKAFRHAEHTH